MYLLYTCTCIHTLHITCTYLYIYNHVYTVYIHLHYIVHVASTGRSSMKQYMPMKPVKRSFKVWVRADAVNGYFCTFEVYIGRPSDGTTTEVGLGERVVLQLSESLRGGNYQLYSDNYFTTCHLLDTLHTHQLYGCGTTRTSHRNFPETLKTVSLERGEHAFCQRGILWHLSGWIRSQSICSPHLPRQMSHTAQRKQKDGSRLSVQCPDTVVLYNQSMAGVDKGDQLRQYYRVRTKCRKNYKYIFWFLFDVAITNSYILSLFAPTTMPNSHQRLKAFRLQLADQLVSRYNSRKRLGRPCSRPAHPPPAIPPLHHLGPLPAQATRTALHLPSRQKHKRRCVYCSQYRNPPDDTTSCGSAKFALASHHSVSPGMRTTQTAFDYGMHTSCKHILSLLLH